MKKRGPAGEGRDRRPKIRPLAAFLLAAALIVTAVQVPGVAAKAVELDTACTLTVQPYSDEAGFANDLPAEEVAIDLYQVADAEAVPGYDTYAYEVREDFKALDGGSLKAENLQDLTAKKWEGLAQQAAKIALGGQGLTPVVAGAKAGKPITNYDGENDGTLKPGLYLIVARQAADTSGTAGQEPAAGQASGDSGNAEGSANAGDTQEPAAGGDADTSGDAQTTESGGDTGTPAADEEEKVTTQIQTDRYIYTFEPQLISIPDKEGENQSTADNPGEWLYNAVATLKPQREERMGSLEIVKTLADQSLMTEEATFVFQVDAYLDEDADGTEDLVYSNVVGMTFTGAGEQRVTLADAIPVGSRVVVTEAYSGASYEISGNRTQEGILAADEILSMAFTNTGNDRHTGGHGIVNSFTYSEENSWEWSADPEQAGTE